jgi:hypothetical protein
VVIVGFRRSLVGGRGGLVSGMSTVTGGRAVSGRSRGSSLGGNCGRWALVGVSGSSLASCRAARAWGVPARVHSASSPGFSPSASPARHTSVTRVGRIGGWLEQTTAPTRSLYGAANLLTQQNVVELDLLPNSWLRAPGEPSAYSPWSRRWTSSPKSPATVNMGRGSAADGGIARGYSDLDTVASRVAHGQHPDDASPA